MNQTIKLNIPSKTQNDCPISTCAEVIADRWSVLILRDIAICNQRTFRSILANNVEKISINLGNIIDPDQCAKKHHPLTLSMSEISWRKHMDFWLDLLFGNAVGLSSMIVIFGAIGLMLFYGGFFIYKIMNDKSPH